MKVELLSLVLVILGLGDLRVAGQSESPVVSLRGGQVRGTTADTFSRKIYAFKGIPYAKPPVGKRRLKDPDYLKHWIGVWDATSDPPSCLQFNRIPNSSVIGDEDCLFLSVFTPSLTPTPSPLPVIFYIHGGAFMYGGSKPIAPTSLLENDVVLVTVNYRLGPLGFLSTGDDAMPGNFGLKDQAMALRWVRDNIAEFGGDPGRVTLAGNSAGGASVHFHYLSPLSQGLFVRGISTSGSTLNPWAITEKAAEKAARLAELLGCPTSNTRNLTTCLRHRPARAIVKQVPAFQVWKELPFAPFGPVVEPPGLNRFLEKSPVDVIANGEVHDLPWMTGFTTHEGIYPANEIVSEPDSMKHLQDNWEQLAPLLLDFNATAANPGVVSQQALKEYLADANIHESIPKFIEIYKFAAGHNVVSLTDPKIFPFKVSQIAKSVNTGEKQKFSPIQSFLILKDILGDTYTVKYFMGNFTVLGNATASYPSWLVGDRIFKVGIIEAARLMSSVNMAKVHLYQYEHRGERSYTEFYNGDKTDYGVSHADDILILLFNETDLKSMREEDKVVSRALAKIWEKYAANGTVDWSPVDTKSGFLTIGRLKQNGEMEEFNVKDIGNVEYWKSLSIEENIRTPAHTEL